MRQLERTKKCTRCGIVKPWSDYYAAVKWEDGTTRRTQAHCKACNRKMVKRYQQRMRKEKPDLIRAKHRAAFARLKADPERMELWRARHRDYQAKRRRAAGKAERPQCSPYWRDSRSRTARLPVGPFAAWLETLGDTSWEISKATGLPDGRIRAYLRREQRVPFDVVDRALVNAMTDTRLDDLYPAEAA